MIRIARLSTSARASAAAAAATSPRAALAAARRVPRASASTSAPAAPASAVAATSPAASAVKRVRATRARVTPPPEPVAELDAEPDIDFLPTDGIQDYAALQPAAPRRARPAPRAAAPTPSPPLTALPGAGYEPLPDLPPSPSDYTSSAVAPGSSPWSPSHPGELGAKTLEDGYAFSRMPGEVAVEDWTTSFRGLSAAPFPKEVAEALLKPLQPEDVEMKPGECS